MKSDLGAVAKAATGRLVWKKAELGGAHRQARNGRKCAHGMLFSLFCGIGAMRLRKECAACWPESCFSGSPDATANSFFFLGIADGALAPEVWVGNGVPTLPCNRVVSLQSRLSVFHGRDDRGNAGCGLRLRARCNTNVSISVDFRSRLRGSGVSPDMERHTPAGETPALHFRSLKVNGFWYNSCQINL